MKREKGKIKMAARSRLSDDVLDPANHKIRVTAFIDGDVLEALKVQAVQQGTRYQTLMNAKLRAAVLNEKTSDFGARLEALEKKVKKMS